MDEQDKAIFIGSDQGGVEQEKYVKSLEVISQRYLGQIDHLMVKLMEAKSQIAELEASEERLVRVCREVQSYLNEIFLSWKLTTRESNILETLRWALSHLVACPEKE